MHEAQDVTAFATQVAAGLKTDRVFLLVDFNAYTHEDPIQTQPLDGVRGGDHFKGQLRREDVVVGDREGGLVLGVRRMGSFFGGGSRGRR